MAKTQEELNKLKDEFEVLNKKLAELTDEELKQVSGGLGPSFKKMKKLYCVECGYVECTFLEGTTLAFASDVWCPQCGAKNSLAIGDA